MKHANKLQEASLVTSVFIFVGKMGCVAFNCYSHFIITKYVFNDVEEVSSLRGPFFIIGCFTYICASMFLGLFDNTIKALLTSLSVDTEAHDRPMFGPPEFH